ncbi:hypothetical protein DF186_19650, partial [Enterococcus hirae]
AEQERRLVDRTVVLVPVEGRVQVDVVHAGLPGSDHRDDDVAVRAEPAGVAEEHVVDHDGEDVVGLRPADALEVQLDGRAERPRGR